MSVYSSAPQLLPAKICKCNYFGVPTLIRFSTRIYEHYCINIKAIYKIIRVDYKNNIYPTKILGTAIFDNETDKEKGEEKKSKKDDPREQ